VCVGSLPVLIYIHTIYTYVYIHIHIGSLSTVAQGGGGGGACDVDGNRESEQANEQRPKVLYTAASWQDICFALFGTEALPWEEAAVF
jgi:hypothetical protein